jgi:preprotein translocase subunit SecF
MNLHLKRNATSYFVIPAVFALIAVLAIILWGLRPGIDLSGGSLLQVTYQNSRPPVTQIQQLVDKLNLGQARIQPTGTNGYTLQLRDLSNDEKNNLETVLGALGPMHEDQFTSVGPSLGAELLKKAWIAISLVTICIILFIAFAFRKVSLPVASWKYGVVAIITLLFDVLIPVGMFAALGHFTGAEVDSLFIVALLTIMGISINDKIVVFDRIRENLLHSNGRGDFGDIVDASITQTLARSINTSLTVVIVLLCLYFFGPASTKVFALTLTVGMIVGTYSSIFFASPLLITWERWSRVTHKR